MSGAFARALLVLTLAFGGCLDWLEVDEGEAQYTLPIGEPLVMPSEPPLVEAPGPLVPRTPGLRVPLAGYWTRARLDAHDLLFPYSWASLSAAGGQGKPVIVVLRLEGAVGQGDDASEPGFRAVIPLTLPAGTDASVIRDGFELPDNALASATMALRTSSQDMWLVTPTRLRFDSVSRVLITGSLEGEARRGAKGQRTRHFTAAFLALRAPDDEEDDPSASNDPAAPDIGGPGVIPH